MNLLDHTSSINFILRIQVTCLLIAYTVGVLCSLCFIAAHMLSWKILYDVSLHLWQFEMNSAFIC